MIHIIGSEPNLVHAALEIYVSGCTRACPGCHNPEAQGYGKGLKWPRWLAQNAWKIRQGLDEKLFRRLWILGGDPLCQPEHEIVELLHSLRRIGGKGMELWLWTGAETLSDVPGSIRSLADFIKTGAYRRELPVREVDIYGDGREFLTLATDNQRLWRVEEKSCLTITPARTL